MAFLLAGNLNRLLVEKSESRLLRGVHLGDLHDDLRAERIEGYGKLYGIVALRFRKRWPVDRDARHAARRALERFQVFVNVRSARRLIHKDVFALLVDNDLR